MPRRSHCVFEKFDQLILYYQRVGATGLGGIANLRWVLRASGIIQLYLEKDSGSKLLLFGCLSKDILQLILDDE